MENSKNHKRMRKISRYFENLNLPLMLITSPITIPFILTYHIIYGEKDAKMEKITDDYREQRWKEHFPYEYSCKFRGGLHYNDMYPGNIDRVKCKSKYKIKSLDFIAGRFFYSINAYDVKIFEFDFIKDYLKLDTSFCYQIKIKVNYTNPCIEETIGDCKIQLTKTYIKEHYSDSEYEFQSQPYCNFVTITFADGQRAKMSKSTGILQKQEEEGVNFYPSRLGKLHEIDDHLIKEQKYAFLVCKSIIPDMERLICDYL